MKLKIFFILLAACSILIAQQDYETRAVWVATNFRLDWPPPIFSEEQQKSELKKILDDVQSKKLNTIYFQVYFNGTALYKSRTVPMSYYLTGVMDDSLAYDPLQFAIDECNKRGIEIHAWINAIRCFTGTENFIRENPKHIMKKHPEWVREKFLDGQKTYWLDPGLPEVQRYIINLAAELIMNYNIDGLQLDFLRYPSADFDDTESYKLYANGKSRSDWRRENLTKIISGIRTKINALNKQVKFGVTPIGIYKNVENAKGLQGYSDVFQDTQLWLKENLIDYAVPQIYWNFEDNPKFDVVAKNWIENSNGKNIVLGIAAYKDDVYNEMEQMIKYSRENKAAGIAFFRYGNIKNSDFLSFNKSAFPAKMNWIDNEPPDEVEIINLALNEQKNIFTINWEIPAEFESENRIRAYLLYKLANIDEKPSMQNLFHLIPSGKNQTSFMIKNPSKFKNIFTLKTVDKFWNISLARSNIVEVTIPALARYVDKFNSFKPVLISYDANKIMFAIYSVGNDTFEFVDGEKNISDAVNLRNGFNIIEQEIDFLNIKNLKIKLHNSGKEYSLKKQSEAQ